MKSFIWYIVFKFDFEVNWRFLQGLKENSNILHTCNIEKPVTIHHKDSIYISASFLFIESSLNDNLFDKFPSK